MEGQKIVGLRMDWMEMRKENSRGGGAVHIHEGLPQHSASAGNAREWMEGEKVQTSDNRGGGDCLLRDQSSIEEKGPKKPFNGLPP